jgi:hypothetical protein
MSNKVTKVHVRRDTCCTRVRRIKFDRQTVVARNTKKIKIHSQFPWYSSPDVIASLTYDLDTR